jgi:signal transduction histidine kinase/CheY-like chemotaxis protein
MALSELESDAKLGTISWQRRKQELRESGITWLGAIPWGTHFWQFFQTAQDLIDVLGPYFKRGLEQNERCVWITSEPLRAAEATAAILKAAPGLEQYLQRQQLTILDSCQWYTVSGKFEPDRALRGLFEAEQSALARGFDGLRAAGNVSWVDKDVWNDFTAYEATLNRLIRGHRIIAVCNYPVGSCSAVELIEVVNSHDFTLAKHSGKWAVLQNEEHRQTESADRAKSEFLTNMSHELRTPMTAILGFSELLDSPSLPPSERREFLSGIRRNGMAMLQLIDAVMDLSQIEAGRLTIDRTDCPLQELLNDVVSSLQTEADKKALSLKVLAELPLPVRIHTDPVRLRQILLNLLANAVKFTERGEVRITLRSVGEGPKPRVQFIVSDTGIGIPADKIGLLFQPFTQVDASLNRRHSGLGLGLAISKRLAVALGGDIQVASEPGHGSTFTLTIDAGPSRSHSMLSAIQTGSVVSAEPVSRTAKPSLRGRVLLVEDDPDVAKVVSLLVQKRGVEVDVAKNGRVACEMADCSKAESRAYALILMDIQMPKMDGHQATQELRRRGWQGPIIALTAHAMAEDREECLRAGCNDYLPKPAITNGLRAVLDRYVGGGTDS